MARRGSMKKKLLSAMVVLGFAATATPAWGMPARGDSAQCIDYGKIAQAPKGRIPKDDLHRVTKDPLKSWVAKNGRAARAAATRGATTTIPVAFHVITKDGTQGNLSNAAINAQIDALNDGYAGTGFQFELDNVTRTASPSWFKAFYTQGGEPRFFRGSHKEIRMKRALHEGDSETLNVYTGALGKFLLGWAWFPFDLTGDDALPRFYDGVVIDYRSLPGGAFQTYNEGDTLTHEVGHWLGLFHTFQGGCTEPGDQVDDTPSEASPDFYCEEGRDTCPDDAALDPGLDPVHNFMDYGPDACLTEFTPGQAERMRQSWEAFRAVG